MTDQNANLLDTLDRIEANLNKIPDALLHDTRPAGIADQVTFLALQVHRLAAVVRTALGGDPLAEPEMEEVTEEPESE
jgi:hypothetical protein